LFKERVMGKTNCEIRIGTSGWHYDDWRGRFYPEKLPKNRWFEHYAQHFDTVEINNTFYHLPREQTMVNWHDKAPADFVYAVKASRYITHIKKLSDPEESLERFFRLVNLLKRRLGPVLYQLPPSLHKDLEKLNAFIISLPKRNHAVFEFRHDSWYDEETFDLLRERRVGFCAHDMAGKVSPRVITGSMVYVRFHGPTGRYAGNYTDDVLAEWADWLNEQRGNVGAIYAYFNNDVEGYAIRNAMTLRELMGVSAPAG
jgi:uncharacterized protein YecE (DUF72 family)